MDRQKTAILIVCAGATIGLFVWLAFLSLRNQSGQPNLITSQPSGSVPTPSPQPAIASPPPKPAKPTVPSNRSTAITRLELIQRGNQYGGNAEWQQAFECWRQVVTLGKSTEFEWYRASAAAVAIGDTITAEHFCGKMLEAYGKSTDDGTAQRCAKECLALPSCSEDLLRKALERADFAVRKDQKSVWNQSVKAMAEYRRGNWSSALDWLREPETSSRLEASIPAWCFGAMARYQLGDADGARKALEQMDKRVKVMVQTGDLSTWLDLARSLGTRAEAERLILGKIVSQPLNPKEIVANREKWKSLAYSTNAAEQMGKQSQWVPAAEYYSKALQDPAFDWTVFELTQDVLCQKMAVVFLMTGDQTRYCDLVRTLLARKVEDFAVRRRYGILFVTHTDFLSPELKTQVLAYARRVCESPEADTDPLSGFLRGQTEYREGRYEAAVQTLGQALFSLGTSDVAARATVFKAMALKRLGRTKEALEVTQEANALFAKPSTLSAVWNSPAYFQLTMKELLALLATPMESVK